MPYVYIQEYGIKDVTLLTYYGVTYMYEILSISLQIDKDAID